MAICIMKLLLNAIIIQTLVNTYADNLVSDCFELTT